MSQDRIDLRSDTVTVPDEEMRRAMAEAVVGDDVYGEDPTVRRLEEESAAAVGLEAALFVPSGTMGNEIALHLHGSPGEEVICDAVSHVFLNEMGAIAALSGLLPRTISSPGGLLDAAAVEAAVVVDGTYHRAPVSSRWRTPTTWGRDRLRPAAPRTHPGRGRAARPAGPLRWRSDLQRRGRSGHHGGRPGGGVRLGDVLSLEGIGSAGGLAPLRFRRLHPGGPAGAQDVRRRHAPGRRPRRGRARRLAQGTGPSCRRPRERRPPRPCPGRGPGDRDRPRRRADQHRRLPGRSPSFVSGRVPPEGTSAAFLARLDEAGVLGGPVDARRVRLVTHRDVGGGRIDEAIERIRAVVGVAVN